MTKINYIEAYKLLLANGCDPSVEFSTWRDMDKVINLIENLEAWNDFNPQVVANVIKLIANNLPKTYYNENNPNNGKCLFNRIKIENDTTIYFIIDYTRKKIDDKVKNEIMNIIKEYGKYMQADEIDLIEEPYGEGYKYIIRFWWD